MKWKEIYRTWVNTFRVAGVQPLFQPALEINHYRKTKLPTGLLFFRVRKLHKTARLGRFWPWDVLRWTMEPTYGGKTAFRTQIRGASQRIIFDQQHLLLRSVDPSKMKAAQPFKALMGRRVTGCRFHQSRDEPYLSNVHTHRQNSDFTQANSSLTCINIGNFHTLEKLHQTEQTLVKTH